MSVARRCSSGWMAWLLWFGLAGASIAAALPPERPSLLGRSFVIDKANAADLAAAIEYSNTHGGTVVIYPEVGKGPLPVKPNLNTRVVDLRYGAGMSLVRGNHPRLSGMWPQYSGLDTGLRKNIVVSDVIPHDASVESWKGEARAVNPENKNRAQTSEEFANTHNHYQNLLSEVWSFSPTINAVALWGDSGAFHPGARSWGGFLSARSWPVHWNDYLPPGTADFKDEHFDAALVGLEVDVLNGGLPHGSVSPAVGIPLSKVGVQIVGFGKRNTAAVELRSEDTDDSGKEPDERRGTWHYGLIEHNALNSASTFLISTSSAAKRGIDFSLTRYADSAIRLNSEGSRTGISFNEYKGGEIYAEDEALALRTGGQGLSIQTPNGRELFWIGRFGLMRWNGINVLLLAVPVLAVLGWLVVRNFRMARELKEIRRLLAAHA